MVKSLIINLRVYKYRVYLFSNFHLISSCTIETKVISTFLRIFSVQKIENSFVVLITRLTCQSSSRKIYENFTYIVYVYIYIYIGKDRFYLEKYIRMQSIPCAQDPQAATNFSYEPCYTWLSSGSAFSRWRMQSDFHVAPWRMQTIPPPPTPPIRTLFSLEFSVFRLIFV